MDKVRIDKWLWAARFFKTRALAKTAIDGGKIHIDGQRTKPSKEIKAGQLLTIRQGWEERTVLVDNLSDQRRGAPEAARLYTETAESLARRQQRQLDRQAARAGMTPGAGKPSKKQRRQLQNIHDLDRL